MKITLFMNEQKFNLKRFATSKTKFTQSEGVIFYSHTPLRYSVINIRGFLSVTAPRN